MITLFTRDGSRVGNAILYSAEMRQYPKKDPVLVFHVETDFGNHMTLTQGELDAMFTIGRHVLYYDWHSDRSQLINEPRTRVVRFQGTMLKHQEILDHFGFVPAPIIE